MNARGFALPISEGDLSHGGSRRPHVSGGDGLLAPLGDGAPCVFPAADTPRDVDPDRDAELLQEVRRREGVGFVLWGDRDHTDSKLRAPGLGETDRLQSPGVAAAELRDRVVTCGVGGIEREREGDAFGLESGVARLVQQDAVGVDLDVGDPQLAGQGCGFHHVRREERFASGQLNDLEVQLGCLVEDGGDRVPREGFASLGAGFDVAVQAALVAAGGQLNEEQTPALAPQGAGSRESDSGFAEGCAEPRDAGRDDVKERWRLRGRAPESCADVVGDRALDATPGHPVGSEEVEALILLQSEEPTGGEPAREASSVSGGNHAPSVARPVEAQRGRAGRSLSEAAAGREDLSERSKIRPVSKRFEFGANWKRFARRISPRQIEVAEASVRQAFGLERLDGMRLLDVGCGSGLFSLAASRLGAEVHSFDYDQNSVECAESLRERYSAGAGWTIERGDALDLPYLEALGKFDLVYSWGVLHHTGAMWQALDNVRIPLAEGGLLYIALYRTKGWRTDVWTAVKRTYVANPLGKAAVLGTFIPGMVAYGAAADMLTRPRHQPLKRYVDYFRERGMNPVWDWVDWLGGYPYETVTAREVIEFYAQRGLALYGCKLAESSMGNHEFLLSADPEAHHESRTLPWESWRPTPEEPLPSE